MNNCSEDQPVWVDSANGGQNSGSTSYVSDSPLRRLRWHTDKGSADGTTAWDYFLRGVIYSIGSSPVELSDLL